MKKTPKNYKFFLLGENSPDKIVYGGNKILLYPFKNMSAQDFSFPFTGISRVREALRIKFKPLLGEASTGVSVIPFFTGNEKKASKGCVFLLFGDETKNIEKLADGAAGDYVVWPAIMAFTGEVGGNGLVIWTGSGLISTLLIDNWVPVYYRNAFSDNTSEEDEREIALKYAGEHGLNADKVFAANMDDLSEDDIQACGNRTLSLFPAYEHLDLSNRGTNLLEQRERLLISFIQGCKFASALGFLLVLLAGGVYMMQRNILLQSQGNAESIYTASFGEHSKQPMSSSLSKVRSLRTPEAENTLHSFLRDIAGVWDKIENGEGLRIETLRYGSENTDIIGTSANNESIQSLRSIIEQEGYVPRVDNIQTIPGGELRFNISISRGRNQ